MSVITTNVKDMKDKARRTSYWRHDGTQNAQNITAMQALGWDPGTEKEHPWENLVKYKSVFCFH